MSGEYDDPCLQSVFLRTLFAVRPALAAASANPYEERVFRLPVAKPGLILVISVCLQLEFICPTPTPCQSSCSGYTAT